MKRLSRYMGVLEGPRRNKDTEGPLTANERDVEERKSKERSIWAVKKEFTDSKSHHLVAISC